MGAAYSPGLYQPPPGTTLPPWPYRPAPPRLGASPSDPVHWLLPTGRSWQAIVAGYLGLVALALWCLGPAAVGFGTWALVRRAREPRAHGRGRAIFGVVAGTIGTVMTVVVAVTAVRR
jgi:hypothetical protein